MRAPRIGHRSARCPPSHGRLALEDASRATRLDSRRAPSIGLSKDLASPPFPPRDPLPRTEVRFGQPLPAGCLGPTSWFLTTLPVSSPSKSVGLLHPTADHEVHRVSCSAVPSQGPVDEHSSPMFTPSRAFPLQQPTRRHRRIVPPRRYELPPARPRGLHPLKSPLRIRTVAGEDPPVALMGFPSWSICACRFPSRSHRHPKTSTRLETRELSLRPPTATRHRPRPTARRAGTCATPLRTVANDGHVWGRQDRSNTTPLPLSRTVTTSEENRAVDLAAPRSTGVDCRAASHLPVRCANSVSPASASMSEGTNPRIGDGQASPSGLPDTWALLVDTACTAHHCAPLGSCRGLHPSRSPVREPLCRARGLSGRLATPTPRGRASSPRSPKRASSRTVQGCHPISVPTIVCCTPKDAAPMDARCGLRTSAIDSPWEGDAADRAGRAYPADLRTEVRSSRGGLERPRTGTRSHRRVSPTVRSRPCPPRGWCVHRIQLPSCPGGLGASRAPRLPGGAGCTPE